MDEEKTPISTLVKEMISTSVEDLQSSLWQYNDLNILRAAEKACARRGEKTKAKIVGVKIRKLQKAAEKERKLKLIQQAYD